MSSLPVGHAERAQAIERLKAAHADGLLDHAECEQRRRQALQARTQDELRSLLADLTGHTTGIEPSTATRLASVRDRIADWLVRALRRAVFCWLPPPGGRRLRAGASLGRATVSGWRPVLLRIVVRKITVRVGGVPSRALVRRRALAEPGGAPHQSSDQQQKRERIEDRAQRDQHWQERRGSAAAEDEQEGRYAAGESQQERREHGEQPRVPGPSAGGRLQGREPGDSDIGPHQRGHDRAEQQVERAEEHRHVLSGMHREHRLEQVRSPGLEQLLPSGLEHRDAREPARGRHHQITDGRRVREQHHSGRDQPDPPVTTHAKGGAHAARSGHGGGGRGVPGVADPGDGR
ncbi:DUF1707 domain-containing protein [Streptomyces sp. ISL-99]|nr:DUF1707 domain-containing protein [Streptomyces sp. ISL-99]